MNSDNNTASKPTSQTIMEAMINVGLIAVLAVLCVWITSPFIVLLLWGLILAVILYPLHQRLVKKRFGGRQGLTATAIVVVGFLLLALPLFMLGESFMHHVLEWRTAYQNSELILAQPNPKVADWPVIGEQVYAAWSEAATNLPGFLEDYAQQLEEVSRAIFSAGGNAIGSIFLFLGALIVAGIMMAYGVSGNNAMKRIYSRLAGPDFGPKLQTLSVETVRSVAGGVLGVAFVQAMLFGIGFILAGIPAAGVLALIVLFIGIIQLPAIVVALPVIIWFWASGDASVGVNIFYTVYFLIAGLSDNFLKPLLLGRGVEAPMPVILIGALGGMIAYGFIGLFLGAILLAIGYVIFMAWVNGPENLAADTANAEQNEAASEAHSGE